jgi:hypothetical protein
MIEKQGYNYFTVLDLKDPFYSIEIANNYKHTTAFEFFYNVYERNGDEIKKCTANFERVMTKILDKEIDNGVGIYMDDVFVC